MRTPPTDLPRRPRRLTRGRIWLIVGVVALIVLILSLRGIAVFWTDYLWFDSVHLNNVWKGMLGAKIGLALVFIAVFFIGIWANLAIADRVAPKFRVLGPEDELVRRYRDAVSPRARLVRTIVALVFALLVGTSASGQWKNWILFQNSVPFGVQDPQFHRDISFYVFTLPFVTFLISWFFLALAVMAIVTAVAHYLNGGIRFQGPGQRVSPQVKAHLSVLLGLMAIDKAIGYFYQRFTLVTSTRGYVEGATYTDVHAQLPALTLLIFISLAAAVLFLVNIRRQGWVLPIIGVGLWLFISLVVGVIYPAFIQTFKVQPSQLNYESPYIERNISATRTAMGLNHVITSNFQASPNLTAGQLAADIPTLSSVRLWDPIFAKSAFEKFQDIRAYYQFNELGLDRYKVDGTLTPAIVAVRQLNSSQIPAQSWVNSHLQYTHGYGAVLSPANTADQEGHPLFVVRDVPPTSSSGVPVITQPSVYFGLNVPGYVIADTQQSEIDFQKSSGNNQEGHYTGSGGVPAGSVVRRAAFALRFGDINPLISGLVTSNSKVMFVRDIRDMVQTAAPFLQFDADPYPVLLNGRIYWVQDAYTTTDRYPYAQRADVSAVNDSSGLNTSFNYVRNSVKILIDAYNGTMTFYQVDHHDPIVNAYAKAFPGMFTPGSKMPQELRAHLRYPEDIFTVQAAMFGRYHIVGAKNFYNAGDAWELSQNPGNGSPSAALATTPVTNAQGIPTGPGRTTRMSPIYQVMQIPGDSTPTFNILDAYVPVSQNDQQQNLTGFMVADSDPAHYGRIQVFETPRGGQVDGPALVDARINASPDISRQISLLNQQGSQVLLGDLLMVPVEQSLIYIRPLYVSSARNTLPLYADVIAVYNQQVAMEPNLAAALTDVFKAPVPGLTASTGSAASSSSNNTSPAPAPTSPSTPSTGGNNSQIASLLQQAQQAYNQAQQALKNGDLAGFQSALAQEEGFINQAAALAGVSGAQSSGSSSRSGTSGSGTSSSQQSGSSGSSPNAAIGRPEDLLPGLAARG